MTKIDDTFVFRLAASATNQDRAMLLHSMLENEMKERVGALFLSREGTPLGLVFARREALLLHGATPGAIFLWALWTSGTEAVIPWHTRLTTTAAPDKSDINFVRRLIDLGGIVGLPVLDHWIFGPRPDRLSLRSWSGWRWPDADAGRACKEPPDVAGNRPPTSHWNPVTGETWSGLGRFLPSWIGRMEEVGLEADAFRTPFPVDGVENETFFGSRGSIQFRYCGHRERDTTFRPPPGWNVIRPARDQVLVTEPSILAPQLHAVLDIPEGSSAWGAIFQDEFGRVRRPTSGLWAPRPLLAGRPNALAAASRQLGFPAIITFSLGPAAGEQDVSLARRLVRIGESVGIPVVDHLFIESPERHHSWRATTRWSWPESDGLRASVWPQRREQEARVIYRDPVTGQVGNSSGGKPSWYKERISQGYTEDELLEPG